MLTIVCYAQVVHHGYCNFDDRVYVTDCPVVRQGLTWAGVKWAFTTLYAANYFPLTWLSLMLDATVWGVNPSNAGPFKATNVAIHIASSCVLLVTLVRATGSVWRSGVVAAIFAIHPLRVESVAWVAERKDVLSVFFGFLAIWAYIHYARKASWKWYATVVFMAVLSLLSKPMFVTLPCILLLLDVWPLRRWSLWGISDGGARPVSGSRLVVEKLPLFALSAVSALITVVAQSSGGAVMSVERMSLIDRFANAVIAYSRYLFKAIWPTDLCYFYAMTPWTAGSLALAAVVLAGISVVAIWQAKRRPWLIVGWLFFLGTFVPVIGIVQVGTQSMADRYTYLPLVGISIALVWMLPESFIQNSRSRFALMVMGCAMILALSFLTQRQVATWRDDEALFEQARKVEPDSWFNLTNYSGFLITSGRPADALPFTERLISLYPNRGRGYVNRGAALEALGRFDDAEACYRQGLKLVSSPELHSAIARLLLKQNKGEEAVAHLRVSVREDPANLRFVYELGAALTSLGQTEEAVEVYRAGVAIDPSDLLMTNNLAVALDQLNRPREAVVFLERAVRLVPNDLATRENLGAIYVRLGDFSGATQQYEWMVRQHDQPSQWRAMAYHRLGLLRSQARRLAEAIECLKTARSLAPDDAQIRNDLGIALAQNRDFDAAGEEFSAALKIDPNHAAARASMQRLQAILHSTTAPRP